MRMIVEIVSKTVLIFLGASTVCAFAQDAYPNRPIRWIVPAPPGGGTIQRIGRLG
jgi:tripartite-type tricarboxylate transporter receptor subunit TctC